MSEPSQRRTGGRAGRQATRLAAHTESVPFLTRTLTPVEVLSEEGIELIEHNADRILEEVGLIFRDYPEAVRLFGDAGADVDGDRVRFPRGMCRRIVSEQAPAIYTQHARNPARSVQIGGNATVLAPNYGSPFVHDLDNGRRYATLADFESFVKLTYASPYLHHSGGTVCEPVDVPVNKRHLDMVYAHLRYSDKPFMGSVTAGSRAQDSVDLARIGFGGDLAGRTVMTSLINASSPLVWDATMLAAAQVYASNDQACLITPFILAGAMAPTTTAAVAAQTLAEALAGMTFVQLVKPGAPVVFGSFASSMSMQTGAPTFGTPEPALVLYVVAQLARRLGVPFRSGGSLTASKVPDAQAAYESANTLQPTILAGVNFVLHAAGWLEGGLAIGYEKFVLDNDQLGHAPHVRPGCRPVSPTARRWRPSSRTAPASTSSAPPTPSPTSRLPSTGRPPPTTPATSSGWRRAPSTPRSEPTRCGRRRSPSTRRRPSMTPWTRSSGRSSRAARTRCATRSAEVLTERVASR